MPSSNFLWGAKTGLELVIEGFPRGLGADEGEFVETVAEDRMSIMELKGEGFLFLWQKFAERVLDQSGLPVGEEFEIDAACGLIPKKDLIVA